MPHFVSAVVLAFRYARGMSETIVTVEGQFDAHHPAERGTVRLRVGAQGEAREPVITKTKALHTALSAEVQAMLDGAKGPVTWWSADRMQVWSSQPWNKDGKQLPLVHHAAVSLEVKFSDLGRLAAWTEEVAMREGVTVLGIDWALTEITKRRLTTEAQHRAVKHAVDKATAYAQSLGLSTVRAIAIADPGMLGDDSRPSAPSEAVMMMRGSKQGASNDALDLKPSDITIAARVHARFTAR